LHSAIGVHLGFANLPFLEFDRVFGVELILFDRALVFDRGVPAAKDGFIGFL